MKSTTAKQFQSNLDGTTIASRASGAREPDTARGEVTSTQSCSAPPNSTWLSNRPTR